jgi:glycosyltransferase involved in cell wall biosynthesis
MRILMIAPQPFMEPRGVPFSVYYHVKVLGMMGYEIDLVTYPIGKPVNLPGLSIYRTPPIPFLHGVKVGPSLAKIPLDFLVLLTALWRLCLKRYKYVYTHEEAGLMGVLLSWLFGCKHLYYMHSDLAQQTVSSEFTKNRLLLRCVDAVQRLIVRKADAVIAICPDIAATAKRIAPEKPVHMIENIAVDEEMPPGNANDAAQLRQRLNLGDGPVLLYTGTLESYQGIDLLLQSAVLVHAASPEARYVIAGGKPEQVAKWRRLTEELGITDSVCFVGQRPIEEMPQYTALADILLSSRSKGTNTPLKLYTYLRSGKPILATNILSHTQILNPEVAMLVPATPEGLAQGALELLQNPRQALALGESGQRFAQEHYSWPVFLEKCRQVYSEFNAGKHLREQVYVAQ